MAQRGCVRCGKCCLVFGMGVTEDDQYRTFNELHGAIYQLDGEHMLVKLRCQAVGFDYQRRAHCVVYDERPQLCRNYLCEAAREEVEDGA